MTPLPIGLTYYMNFLEQLSKVPLRREPQQKVNCPEMALLMRMAVRGDVGVQWTASREELEQMLREAAKRLGARLPRRLLVAVRPLTEAYFRTTARGGELRVVINDALSDAPMDVLEALSEVIIARASGAARPRMVGKPFWDHVETEELRERMQANYLARQRSFDPEPQGRVSDLAELFDAVNEAYFESSLPHPLLGWTRRPITYRWGWYSSMVRPHGLIVINCLLDDPKVPRFVLEGTMYHEMLHMQVDPVVVNGRRVVHTRQFRTLERRFDRHEDLRPEYRKVLRRYGREVGAVRRTRGRRGRR